MRAISRRHGVVPSILVLIAVLVPGVGHPAAAAAAPRPPVATGPYADPARWICRPDKSDVCDGGLDATVIHADGSTRVERWAPARRPPVDCFYVYPTTSYDPSANSDLVPFEENLAANLQAARLGSSCRVFVPLYRQVTVTWLAWATLFPAIFELFPPALVDVAYGDVVAAFRHYLAHDNHGRGIVLVGHSQGAMLLSRLLRDEIAPSRAVRSRLVSALLPGIRHVDVPPTSVIRPCRSPHQTDCLVTFVSFRDTSPPPPGGMFTAPAGRGTCTNPAALGGGRAPLRPYFATLGYPWIAGATEPISTPYVTLPGLIEAQCSPANGPRHLSVSINGNPADPRTDDIPGDVTPELGLHLAEVQLVMGDLVELVDRQGHAHRARGG